MSDPTDVFGTEKQETPAVEIKQETPVVVDPFATQLQGIVNQDGAPKYNDTATALAALKESQNYIPTLQADLEAERAKVLALEKEVQTFESVEDMVDRLSSNEQPKVAAPAPTNSLDQEAVLKLVNQTLLQRQEQEVAKKNYDIVVGTLTEKYGDKTQEIVASKAAELGVTPETLRELSAKSPSLVLGHFDAVVQKNVSTPAGSVHIPPTPVNNGLEPPKKSLLLGATSQEQADYMRQIKEDVYKEFDIK